jgi:hypothetical protein
MRKQTNGLICDDDVGSKWVLVWYGATLLLYTGEKLGSSSEAKSITLVCLKVRCLKNSDLRKRKKIG